MKPCLRSIMILAAVVLAVTGFPAVGQIHRPVSASRGMVVSACPIAAGVGARILASGGNAIDAAVAVGFALAVTYPSAGNLGGGGFMIIHGDGGHEVALDYREMAPRKAHRDLYLDKDGRVVPSLSVVGHLAAGVPGSVAGMLEALEHHGGSLSRAKILAPAIDLARNGFVISPELAASLRSSSRLKLFAESRRVLLHGGLGFRAGEVLKQPQLAKTLERIRDEGRAGFYQGETARLVAAEMKRGHGIMDEKDLKAYRVVARKPLRGRYRGRTIVSMPPPSSGGIALLQMLALLEPYPLSRFGANSARSSHLLAEVMRLAFRDRARYLGDPDFTKIPTEHLISAKYADLLRPGIGEMARPSRSLKGYDAFTLEPEETTHYSVMDEKGRAVSCTTTLNGSFGSGVLVPGAGFLLNNEMDDFAAAPGSPNMYGLIQGEANSVGARKRPLSSMTPTLVEQEDKVVMVIGSPGGPTIINTVLQCIINRIDYGMNIAQAIAAPRIHHQWLPDRLDHEGIGMNPEVARVLKERGHLLHRRSNLGNAQGITRSLKSGRFFGASDVRGNGAAVGF